MATEAAWLNGKKRENSWKEQKTLDRDDVVYGGGFAALDKEPMVFQVPDFGKRFWVYPIYDHRTSEIGKIGQQYGTSPGFYMIVGPNWNGEVPAGITAIVRSSTNLTFAIPRIQQDDTAEDKRAIQEPLSKVMFYPLSQFDGKMKSTDWSKIPSVPMPPGPPTKWVNPETYFEQLPSTLKEVPPLLGHQFSQYLVLGLDLFFQELDALLFGLVVRSALAWKGGSAILEELFLPTVEHRGLQPMFLAQIGNRHFIQQVPPQDGNLLFPGVMLSFFFHASSPLS